MNIPVHNFMKNCESQAYGFPINSHIFSRPDLRKGNKSSLFRKFPFSESLSKEIKNAPSALLSYISTREFLRTREKHEPKASTSRTSRVFLKIPGCFHNSTMHEEQVFYFFYKIKTTTKGQEFVREQKRARILIDQH